MPVAFTSLKKPLMTLGTALGVDIADDFFDEAAGWLVVQTLVEVLEGTQRLSQAAFASFEELHLISRGSEVQIAAALTSALGPDGMVPLARLVQALGHAVRHLDFAPAARAKVVLESPSTFVPLKNYDFS